MIAQPSVRARRSVGEDSLRDIEFGQLEITGRATFPTIAQTTASKRHVTFLRQWAYLPALFGVLARRLDDRLPLHELGLELLV